MSAGTIECVTPDRPPIVNIAMNPSAKSIGVFIRSDPPQTVPSQLKIFTPVGMAMSIVESPNAVVATGPRPVANMWCAHTPQPRKPMAMPEKITTDRPNSGLREKTGRISETMPMPGRIRMYTSGWPNNQKRCWYSSGSPPADATKKFVEKLRSKKTMISAAVTAGIANTVRNAVTSIIHTKTGIRMSVMPGARMLRIVTTKLTPDVTDPMPSITRPTAQKSGPWPGSAPAGDRRAGERRVPEPAAVRRAAEHEPGVDEQATEGEDPEPEHVEPRERDVAGADLERDQVVAERDGAGACRPGRPSSCRAS